MQITVLCLFFSITITVSSAWKQMISEITTDELNKEELYLMGQQPVYDGSGSGSGEAESQQDIKEDTGVVLKSGYELNELLANYSRPQADPLTSGDPLILFTSDDDYDDEREFSGEGQDVAVWDQWTCKEENEYCYYLSTQIKTWLDAHQDCLQLGGMLPFWIKTAKPYMARFDGLAMWSSLHWYNGRLHEFDESWNSPKIKDFSEMDESLLRYVAEQKRCFAITNNVWDVIFSTESELHLEGYSCNLSLPYFCIAQGERLNRTQEVLKLPLETAVDVRLEKIVNNGAESLQCTPEFQTQSTTGKRRPFTIVWIVDHMYHPHTGYNGFNGVNTLTVPYENFTNYACEVRYLGLAYGNLSREIDVPLLATPKLGLVLRIKNPLSPNTSLDYSQKILETLAAHNSKSNVFTLTATTEPSFFDGIKSEFVSITYFLVNFLNESYTSYRSLAMQCSSKSTTNTSSLTSSDQQKFPFSSLESNFVETLRQETVSTELLLVDRCNAEDITEELVWIGLAGQEVIPSARKLFSQSCVDDFGNSVTRTCEGSLISGAKWVEPFSIEQNCSKMEESSVPTLCPVGYTKMETDSKEYCVKQVLPLTWNDAMAACFGGHLKHPYYSNNYYDVVFWIVNTLAFIRASNGTSSQSINEMLWLPSKRRVPGGPLYPYSISSDWSEKLSTENNGQSISSSEYIFKGTDNAIEREPQLLDYRHLNADKQCLAWSIKEQILTTHSCSEQHPTICIKTPMYAMYDENSYSPDSYNLAECSGFDIFAPNEFGINSCYRILKTEENTDVESGIGFTWEEALLACQRKHPNATLAVTASNPMAYFVENILREKAFHGEAWLGIRQSHTDDRKNNQCRFLSANNECVRQPYGIDSKTDFRYGVDASIKRSILAGNEDFFRTFQLPQKRLRTAICQLDFNPSHIPKITYRLMLEWLNYNTLPTNYFRIVLNYDGIPGRPFRDMNWDAVKSNIVCFQDGKFRRVTFDLEVTENEVLLESFPTSATSVFCESMGVDSILLRSNTLVTRQSEYLFAITVIDKSVTIVKQSSANSTIKLYGNSTYPKQGFDHQTYMVTKLEYAKQFEPSAAHDSHFETSFQSYNYTFHSLFNHSENTGNYVLSNIDFGRIATNSDADADTDNLLVRYHVIFLEKDYDTKKLSQEEVYRLVYDKVKSTFSTIPNAVFEKLKSKKFCLEERVWMTGRQGESFDVLTWPETELNRTVYSREGCFIEGSSLVQRTCRGDIYHGTEWGSPQAWNREGKLEVLQRNFVCSKPTRTTSQLINMTQIRENSTSMLAELQDVTSEWQPSMVDIQLTALIFSSASNEETSFSETDIYRVQNIITQVSTIETETLASAQNIPNVATNFLTGLEDILTRADSVDSTLITSTLQGRTTAFKTASSLLFAGNSTQLGQSHDMVSNTSITRNPTPSTTAEHDAAVFLNSSSLTSLNKENNATIAFLFHPNVRLVDAAAAEGKRAARVFSPNPSDGDGELLLPRNYTPNSVLIQVGFKGGSVKLAEPISIYFRPFRKVNSSNSSVVVCVFWNPDSNAGGGGWSTEGCWYVGNENGLDHCQCNHLSAFTTLFAYEYEHNDGVHVILLDLLTMIGCSLSLLGLIGVIATYMLFPHWRKPARGSWSNHIIFNLSVALATLLTVFIAGFDQVEDARICLLVAIVLHYSMLAVFCWMLVEAYVHYLRYVKVFDTYIPRFMLKASLFAWITPMIPVILLLVVKIDYYYYTDNNNYCWLTPEGFYYALLPFVVAVTLINVITYVRIIINVAFSKSTLQSNQNQADLTLRHVHMAMATFVLLGLSWIFGLLAIGGARTIFSYLFCTFNSMQGFAIFWLFIFKEKRARELWANFLRGISHRDLARQRNRLMVQAGANDTSTVSRSKTTGTNGTQDSKTNASNSHDTSTVPRSKKTSTPNSYELHYM